MNGQNGRNGQTAAALSERIQDLIDHKIDGACKAEAAAFDAALTALLACVPDDARPMVFDLEERAAGYRIAAAEVAYRLGLEHGAQAGAQLVAAVRTVKAARLALQ